ncbi:MAG: zinc ribbon domain-containing protein [Oscillospiraceae bacterium]|nr:zinc ribbon domain-containing protein [Oscillospiraceae bacterium]
MADNWDKFVDGAREVAGTVADAAGGLYEKGKDYIHIKRLEWQLRDNYRKLGILQYQAETGTEMDEEEKAALVTAIGEIIDELKNSGSSEQKYEFAACKECGAMIAGDARFCPSCGVKVEE